MFICPCCDCCVSPGKKKSESKEKVKIEMSHI